MVSLYPYEDDFNDMYKVGEAAIPIVESDDYKGKGFTLKATGMAYTETEEHAVIMKEASLRIISGFFVMILCLVIFIRSFRGIIVPLFAIVGGIGTVFGFMGWFNISADSSLVTLPILLGMALAVGYSNKYINSFKRYLRESGKRKESVINAVKETSWPILFTAFTTIASMISFTLVDIGPLAWLGTTCATIVLSVFIYVIILVPVLLSFGKDKEIIESCNLNIKSDRIEKSVFLTKTDKF